MDMSAKVKDRIVKGLKSMMPVIDKQKAKDVSEADTVTIVKDVLSDVFGYDKYAELTSEHAIRGTFCDLAVKVDDKLLQLIEIKSAGTPLDDRHVKQVVDYAANQGVDWVVLTNGSVWRLYSVAFTKPIDKRLILEVDLTAIETRKEDQLEQLYLFCREGLLKGAPSELRDRQDATSRYLLAALLVENDNVIDVIRRELRRVVDVLVDEDEIIKVLRDQVIKRETLEGADAEKASRKCCRQESRAMRKTKPSSDTGDSNEKPATAT